MDVETPDKRPASPVTVAPMDEHNQALVANVHPTAWVNPTPNGRYHLVVLGAGTAGLVTAAGAAGLGARVALIERHLLGGDCLNVGCVPSKAIIRPSRAVADVWAAEAFGVRVPPGTAVDFPAVMARMRRLRARISRHDSAASLTAQGVHVFFGDAHFVARDAVEVSGQRLRFAKAVIAAGARAVVPPIEGLTEAGFLTNETVFSLTERPPRLAVIGGGPLGCELAQAFRRLGSAVTVFEAGSQLMGRADPEAAALIRQRFLDEGISLVLRGTVRRVTRTGVEKVIHYEIAGRPGSAAIDEILVGVGRAPNVEGLNLEAAGVRADRRTGVVVNDRLQTTNPAIYAAGDVCLAAKFTHTADATARIVIQNALFLGRRRVSRLTIPWCTYTDPEVAHVGLSEAEARQRGMPVTTFVKRLSEVDRAIVDGEEEGFVKIHVRRGTDRILGATIVARHAGEMISEITVAMAGGVGLAALSGVIHPYPTQAEAIRQLGDAYQMTRLTPRLKRLLTAWLACTR